MKGKTSVTYILKGSVRSISTGKQANPLVGKPVYIVSCARTPVGKFFGGLKSLSATDLGSIAAKGAIERSGIKESDFDTAYIGNVLQANIGQSPARQVVLKSGLPVTVDATTVNKVCSSGLKSVTLAAQSIQVGQSNVVLAGGMESMSNVPYYIPRSLSYGNATAVDGILNDALIDVYDKIHMGLCAENTAKRDNISREEQDEYTIESYKKSLNSIENGLFKDEIVPVEIKSKKGSIIIKDDEEPSLVKFDKIKNLKPVFDKNGTVTAANASAINDGASALVLASEDKLKELGVNKVLAKIISYADAATNPIDFTIAPSLAVPKALKKAGLTIDDISAFELNEAFAAVAIVNTRILKLDSSKVNIKGGAVALGHPVGSSGSRILVTLLNILKEGEYGVAGICNGGGAATALVVQKVSSI